MTDCPHCVVRRPCEFCGGWLKDYGTTRRCDDCRAHLQFDIKGGMLFQAAHGERVQETK